MNDNDINRLIQEALDQENALPQGLSQRLEQRINRLAAHEGGQTAHPANKKRRLYWLSGIAASLLVGAMLLLQTERTSHTPLADTYSDPAQAAIAAQEALTLLSTRFNKGMDQMAEAKKDVEQINAIINKQFNSLNAKSSIN